MVVCSICQKFVSCKSSLTRHHKQVHAKIKDKVCSFEGCVLKFSTKSDLDRHIAYVHSENTLKCIVDTCPVKFATKQALAQHVKGVHNDNRDCVCTYEDCIEKFHTPGKLKRHIEGFHQKLQSHVCGRDGCPKTFTENSNLVRHIKTVHDRIREFHCEKCNAWFFENNHLKNHIRLNSCNKKGSSGENKVKEILEKFGFIDHINTPDGSDDYVYINDEPWKTFENFRTTKDRALRFDFRIPMIGAPLIIEFDGSQHFSPQKFGAKITDEQAKTKFEKQLRYDKEKNEFCEEEGIPILRIPHWDFDKCEELIKEFLESYTTWTAP